MPSSQILNNLPALIGYWDKNLRNRFGNQAYVDWFGISPEQMRGKHLREVIGEERFRLNWPFVEGALSGVPQTFERIIPSPDGKVIRHSLAHYVPDVVKGVVRGFYVLVTDVTPVIALRSALEASEKRYRAIVQDQTEVISRFTPDGRFLFVNEVYCRFFGKSEKELLGNRWLPICDPDDVLFVQEKLQTLSEGNPVVLLENRVRGADGRVRWMQFVNRGFFKDGELVEIQSVGREITDRKLAEQALQTVIDEQEEKIRLRTEELHRLTVEAILAEAREREAIARDLHDDIGQLLHVVKLRLDALRRKAPAAALGADIAAMDELIGEASQRVRSLTAQLSPPVLESLGLVPSLSWLAKQISSVYGLRVRVTDDGMPKPLNQSMAVILFRAARELLINVVKHADSSEASLSTWMVDGAFVLEVSDRGRGMPIDVEHHAPAGFGLRSLRERVSYLGGALDIKSGNGKGSSVTIRVPMNPS